MPNSFFNRLVQPLEKFLENPIVRRLLKNSAYLFSATGIASALSMLQGILTARLLGVENFGILGAITLFTSVINKLASFRMGELVVKYVGQFTEDEQDVKAAAIFKLALFVEILTTFVAFLLVLILAPLAARLFAKDPATTGLFMMYGLVIPVNMISESSTGLLQISDRFKRIASINIVQSSITLVLITIIYFYQGGLREILIAYLIGKSVGAVALAVSSILQASTNWGSAWIRAPINSLKFKYRELTNFAVNTNISATISLVTKDSEVLWVSFLRNPVEAGYYKLALSLANIVQLPISPLPQSTYPELSRQAASKQWDNMKYIMRQGSILAGGYTLIATILLIILGPQLIRLIYTPEYLPAYSALVILLGGLLIANTFYWRRAALLSLGHPDFPAKVNFILAAIKVALMFLLVPKYGYLASAALLSGFYISGSLIYVLRIRKIMNQKSTTP